MWNGDIVHTEDTVDTVETVNTGECGYCGYQEQVIIVVQIINKEINKYNDHTRGTANRI